MNLAVDLPRANEIVRKWFHYFEALSLATWLGFKLRERSGKLRENSKLSIVLRQPNRPRIALREGSSDTGTFWEIFDMEVYRELAELAHGSKTVIDLGANIGLASLFLAFYLPDCRIVAVEPSESNLPMLNENLSWLISAERARVLHAAVWNREAELLFSPSKRKNAHDAGKVRESTSDDEGGDRIQGKSPAGIIEYSGFETVDILKIDIEGAEATLFEGDLSWLDKVRIIAIEFHNDSREQSGFDSIIVQHGFSIVSRNLHTVVAKRS